MPSEIGIMGLSAWRANTQSIPIGLECFNHFNLLIWVMTFMMGLHCVWSTYVTKSHGSVVKSLAQVGSWVFPTYASMVFLGVEKPTLLSMDRPLFGLICVLTTASYFIQTLERNTKPDSKLKSSPSAQRENGEWPDNSHQPKGDESEQALGPKRDPPCDNAPDGQPSKESEAGVPGELAQLDPVALILICVVYATVMAYGIQLWLAGSRLSNVLPIATRTIFFTLAIRLLVWLGKWKWMKL